MNDGMGENQIILRLAVQALDKAGPEMPACTQVTFAAPPGPPIPRTGLISLHFANDFGPTLQVIIGQIVMGSGGLLGEPAVGLLERNNFELRACAWDQLAAEARRLMG